MWKCETRSKIEWALLYASGLVAFCAWNQSLVQFICYVSQQDAIPVVGTACAGVLSTGEPISPQLSGPCNDTAFLLSSWTCPPHAVAPIHRRSSCPRIRVRSTPYQHSAPHTGDSQPIPWLTLPPHLGAIRNRARSRRWLYRSQHGGMGDSEPQQAPPVRQNSRAGPVIQFLKPCQVYLCLMTIENALNTTHWILDIEVFMIAASLFWNHLIRCGIPATYSAWPCLPKCSPVPFQ